MTREQVLEKLVKAQEFSKGDPEAAHSIADRVLCDLLIDIGYADVVEAYRKVRKWYA